MAEAHAAVGFSFQVTPEGVDFQISPDALWAVYKSGVRSWRKRYTRFKNRFQSGVYPARFSTLGFYWVASVISAYFLVDLTFGLRSYIHRKLFESHTLLNHVACLSIGVALLWLLFALILRYFLKLLFCYQGWMFEPRGKPSTTTKIWAMIAKVLSGSNPDLYSLQASLPRLPVPALDDTIKRYLRSVRPLLDDDKYETMKELSEEFLSTIASRLQRYLVLKSWWSTNYVSDWWEQYVYLAGRTPIMVNSNYYGLDLLYHVPTSRQVSRAASIVHSIFKYRSLLDREKIKPIRANGLVTLCSAQYERQFNTTRIPGVECDTLEHHMDARHIAVYHQGRWFKVFCYQNGTLLNPAELELTLQRIMDDESEPAPGEKDLAALTASDRTPWALVRKEHFGYGLNKKSLRTIEKAAFVLVLDDSSHDVNDHDPTGVTAMGRSLLHGNCNDRWFDKSFNLVAFKNGKVGVNAEHSWADAPIVSYLVEYALGYEFLNLKYNMDGTVAGKRRMDPIYPQRLKWRIPQECIASIDSAMVSAKALADDVHLHVFAFTHFGKGLVKTFKVSPDAFIQTALQIAQLRDQGKFCLTYEASMTRLFREGRTETVRSCTNEMAAFVKTIDDQDITVEEKHALFLEAVERHATMYKEAMTGAGIDRHLFCLYVVSKFLKLDSPFLQKVLMEPWRLSTSQTPHQQAMIIDLNKNPKMIAAGGGFGPVSDDGYGVSYMICHENLIMFHVSSKHKSLNTDSERFANNIEKAMLDLRDMCESMKKKKK